jgi:adenine-specific DNA-methyltransferase
MEKLKFHTLDITNQNIEKLAELFPTCVTEAEDDQGRTTKAIDFDQLRQELSGSIVEGPRERYHLEWPGKREAILAGNAPIAKTLRPSRDESVDFDTTKNLFIEGDNLDALKLLQETYLGKVKLIYIDPPYNTGNDFVYDDDFVENSEAYLVRSNQKDDLGTRLIANTEANGRFHSDWLDMIYPRLKLARNLLREDGVIMISIDDHEYANLCRVCDEIFGAANFEGTFVWQRKQSPQRDATNISATHDYIVVYSRRHPKDRNDNTGWLARLLPMGEEQLARYSNPDSDPRGLWTSSDCTINKTAKERPNLYYSIKNPITGADVFPSQNRTWSFDRRSMDKLLQENRLWWGESGKNFPRLKAFLTENQQGVKPQTLLLRSAVGDNQAATRELNLLFPEGNVFDTPKPTSLIRHLIRVANVRDNDLVLDFFAGSGTTADALLQMNAEDGGTRRYLLVQVPELYTEESLAFSLGFKTIAETARERIRRASEKLKRNLIVRSNGVDFGFRSLRVDVSNMLDVYYAPDALTQGSLIGHTDNIRPDRTAEDLLFQVLVDWGLDLALPVSEETIEGKRVSFVDANALAACFDSDIADGVVKEIAKRKPLRAVFRDSSYGSDSVKINVEQIFRLLSPETEVRSI